MLFLGLRSLGFQSTLDSPTSQLGHIASLMNELPHLQDEGSSLGRAEKALLNLTSTPLSAPTLALQAPGTPVFPTPIILQLLVSA